MTPEVEVITPTAADRPRPDGSDIRKMTAAEIQPVARTLAQAFYGDPHFRWSIRDDAERMHRLKRGFALPGAERASK